MKEWGFFTGPPPPVGGYDLGHVMIHVTRRPNWFQQKMAEWFFGWKWNDKQ